MREISEQMKQSISANVTTLATCWEILVEDGMVLRVTSHSEDVMIEGEIYRAGTGLDNQGVISHNNLEIDKMFVGGVLDSTNILEKDILSGRYDNAVVRAFIVDYANPDRGKINIFYGKFGNIKLKDERFVVDVYDIKNGMQSRVTDDYSPFCRAEFCDQRCGLNIDDYMSEGSVIMVLDNGSFVGDVVEEDMKKYNFGLVEFLTGNNNGKKINIKRIYEDGNVETVVPFINDIMVGDRYRLFQGCDKSVKTCKYRFNNVVNFRGEPHAASVDNILNVV